VSVLRGSVNAGQRRLAAGQTQQLAQGGELETPVGAEARIKTENGLQLDVLENSKVSLSQPGRTASELKLERGRVRCVVEHRPERTFEVVTAVARIVDIGTVFSVSVEPDASGSRTVVHVEEGAVLVRHAAGQTRLGPTQTWVSAAEPPAVAPPAPVGLPSVTPSAGAVVQPAPSLLPAPSKRRAPSLAVETELLQSGLLSEQRGDLRAAESAFKTLVARYPASPLAPDAKAALARVRSRLESGK
jgi:ferric-dicitrate binding protein FerR (iron transport regulator)